MVCKERLRKGIKMTHLERICLKSGDLQSFVLLHGNLGTQIKHVIGVTLAGKPCAKKWERGRVKLEGLLDFCLLNISVSLEELVREDLMPITGCH